MKQLYELLSNILKNSNRAERSELAKELEKWKIRILFIDALEEEKKIQANFSKPFVGFIKYKHRFGYDAYLVNPTDKHYERVVALTGAQAGDEEGVYETSKALCERGDLPPRSAIVLETDHTLGGLDWLIWYHLDLYEKDKNEPERYIFSFPKHEYKDELLPVLNRDGMIVELGTEHREKTILEDVKTRDMTSGYWKDGKKLYS